MFHMGNASARPWNSTVLAYFLGDAADHLLTFPTTKPGL